MISESAALISPEGAVTQAAELCVIGQN